MDTTTTSFEVEVIPAYELKDGDHIVSYDGSTVPVMTVLHEYSEDGKTIFGVSALTSLCTVSYYTKDRVIIKKRSRSDDDKASNVKTQTVPASTLRVGDILIGTNGATTTVDDVEDGDSYAFHVMTPFGTLTFSDGEPVAIAKRA